jgi:hypothetical protein
MAGCAKAGLKTACVRGTVGIEHMTADSWFASLPHQGPTAVACPHCASPVGAWCRAKGRALSNRPHRSRIVLNLKRLKDERKAAEKL